MTVQLTGGSGPHSQRHQKRVVLLLLLFFGKDERYFCRGPRNIHLQVIASQSSVLGLRTICVSSAMQVDMIVIYDNRLIILNHEKDGYGRLVTYHIQY
jgi:hypothetical protein